VWIKRRHGGGIGHAQAMTQTQSSSSYKERRCRCRGRRRGKITESLAAILNDHLASGKKGGCEGI
jgi:hypothetical protein